MPTDVSSNAIVRFGVFEADLRSGELRKSGVRVKIQELPFQALRLLLSRPNEVLSRDDLRQSLWPDGVYVDFDRGVISAINRLRDALGDSAENPVFIETVGRRGYRWIAPAQISEPVQAATSQAVPEGTSAVSPSHSHGWRYAFAALLVTGLALGGALWLRHNSTNSRSSREASALTQAGFTHRPANREAEEFYLKGRYYWEKRTPESLNTAVDSFTQAIVHDPNYAQAYVGLADCYNLLREYTAMPSSEAYPRAFAAAKKAVELDDQSSQAHASLAFVSFNGMWDAAAADREYRRAISLDPKNAIARHWYATYLESLTRYSESIAEVERAQALDPGSKSILADKASIFFAAGRKQEAIALLQQMEENEPNFSSPHRYLAGIYLLMGDYPHYLSESRTAAVLMHDATGLDIANATEKAFATGGGPGLLEALRLEQQKLYDRGQFSPYYLAQTYAFLGNKKEALRYLKVAYNQHSDGLAEIKSIHAFDNLHDEPAYRQLLGDLGLPPMQ